MKIERISENQIRCTLGKADLADKDLLINELAYGTDKAKELFREMMTQASDEVGFEADDIPLMIEAIPVSPECLILIITKVEDPEELDTRFSRFSKPSGFYDEEDEYEDEDEEDSEDSDDDGSDTIMNVIGNMVNDIEKAKELASQQGTNTPTIPASKKPIAKPYTNSNNNFIDNHKIFCFNSLDEVNKVADLLKNSSVEDNTLYKNPSDNKYYLVISKPKHGDESYTRTCNLISEYGNKVKATYATPYHYNEHFKIIIKKSALQTLASL